MLYQNKESLWYEASLDAQADPSVRILQEVMDGKWTDMICTEGLVMLAGRAIALGKAVTCALLR